ncbi:MAG: immune inhibitor A [Chloroflexi bacterium]|nr:immune inhibitor A [Chloroflexota bacterium]
MERIYKLLCIWMVLAIALAGLAPAVSAQAPEGSAEKHLVPPRPDLLRQIQMAEGGGERLNVAASQEDTDPSLAYRQYLAQKLAGHFQGGRVGKKGVSLSAEPPHSRVMVLLVEFDDAQHNEIPQPPPSDLPYDYWVANFSQAHYNRLAFDQANAWSLSNWVKEASDGLFPDLQGTVRPWAQLVGKNLTDYGDDDPAGGVDNTAPDDLYQFVRDAVALQLGGTYTPSDGWGNYHGGDGYLDYLIIVHAGRGQESGGGVYGDDSLWSTCGTLDTPYEFQAGLYVDRFVVVAEDSPVGVWAHELGHLFGLPDTWNVPSAADPKVDDVAWPLEMEDAVGEASPAFYDPMAQGCWLGMPMGTRPASMTSWERIQLEWLTPRVWDATTDLPTSVYLAQLETPTAADKALRIDLPPRTYVTPHTGDYMWVPTCYPEPEGVPCCEPISATNYLLLSNLLVPEDGTISLNWWQWYDLIEDYDLGYVVVVDHGGTLGWATRVYTVPFGSSLDVPGNADGWVHVSVDLGAFKGTAVDVYFILERLKSPGGLGWFLDTFELVGDGIVLDSDDLEEPEWTWDPIVLCWQRDGPIVSEHYYLLEWRNDQAGFDVGLQEAYNWAQFDPAHDILRVEYFRYNPGLLIWYVNPVYRPGDNNVLWHPGEGFLLAIDSHAVPLVQPATGEVWRTRVQMQDATFRAAGHPTYENTLTYYDNGTEYQQTIGPKSAKTYFWDKYSSYPYWDEDAPYNSAKTVQYGVRVDVRQENQDQSGAQLDIGIDAADMSQSYKLVDQATARPGETLRYTIVLINNGIADAHQIVVSDTAPMYTDILPGTFSVTGSPNTVEQWATSDAVYWKGTVPLGSPVTLTFDVVLESVIPDGYIIVNEGRIYEGNVLETIVRAETEVESEPCLTSSTKVAEPSEALAGDLITYTITLINTGNTNAETVTITDCLPQCTTYWPDSLTYTAGNGSFQENVPGCDHGGIVWQGPVYVGVNTVITFVVQIQPGQLPCTLIQNEVTIDDGVHQPFHKWDDTSVIPGPNFWTSEKVVETEGGTPTAAPGETLTYTVYVNNVGNQASYAEVTDAIPANTTYVPGSLNCSMGTCSEAGGVISWVSNSPLAPASGETISFQVVIDSPLANGTIITNTALITSETQVFTREVTTTVISEPRLTNSTKEVETGVGAYGSVLTYTISLYNDGTEDANVVMTDAIPDGTEYIPDSLSASKPTASYSAGVVTWTGTVARGELVTVTYAVTITLEGSGVITNCATVDDGVHDPFEICSSDVYVAGLTVDTDDTVYACGDLVSVPIVISNVVDLQAFQITIDFITDTLQAEGIVNGTWFGPYAAWSVKEFDNEAGRIIVAATLISQPTGKSGSGILFWINFRVVGVVPSPTPITIVDVSTYLANSILSDGPPEQSIPYYGTDGELYLEGRTMIGYVDLQGRADESGAIVQYDGQTTWTNALGFYEFCPPAGYGELVHVRIELDGYLWAEEDWPVSAMTGTISLPDVTLYGGNPVGPSVTVTSPITCTAYPTATMPIAGPPDDVINILDLTFVGARFNMVEDPLNPWEPIDWFDPGECYYKKDLDGRADITNDGRVDIFDLVLVGYNFNETAPVPWF